VPQHPHPAGLGGQQPHQPQRIATAIGAGAVVRPKAARVMAAITPMAMATITAPATNSRSSKGVVSLKWAGTPRACWTTTQATS
jgi:hypothetical protein